MPGVNACNTAAFEVVKHSPGVVSIYLSGIVNVEACAELLAKLPPVIAEQSGGTVTVDMSAVSQADDYGVFVINELKRLAAEADCQLYFAHLPETVKNSIALFETFDNPPGEPPKDFPATALHVPNTAHLISEVGQTTLAGIQKAESSVSFIGAMALAVVRAVASPGRIRFNDIIILIKKNGIDAIPIVALISFISGLITAFVASVELEKYGGHIFIPSLITFAMVAEVGPIMTATIIAGRTGSAYAAEIGTMKINEEIDALTSMSLDPFLFLAIPRLLTLLVALPILTVFAVIAAIGGGMAVSIVLLHLMPGPFIQGVLDALFIDDITWGLVKSGMFAILISLVGCLRGFQVRGGAASVGSAATSAVVSGLFLIVLCDSIVAIIRVYWG